MSQKVTRKGPHKVMGRRSGEPETSALHDERLTPDLSYNNAAPLIAVGDEQVSLVQVKCRCGAVVGVVWRVDRSGRNMAPLTFLQAQVIADPEARPPVARMVENILAPSSALVADCVVHGRHAIVTMDLLNVARRAFDRAERGAGQMMKFVLPRAMST